MSESLGPEQRSLRARLAAHSKWAGTDPVEGTRAAREAFLSSFEKQVDPDGTLDPDERARRADHARKAHFLKLAFLSARARRAKSR